MSIVLFDTNVYEKTDHKIIYETQRWNKSIRKLINNDDKTYSKFIKQNPKLPRLYGLHKFLKPGISMQPIIFVIVSVSHRLVKTFEKFNVKY